jgi:uncharacterized membrane protein YkoI
MRIVSRLLLALILGSAAVPWALADEDDDYGGGDQERARAARQRGEILPLGEVLARARSLLDGRMIETELEREDGRWVYELTLLTPDGQVVEALFDAASAELLELEGEGLERLLKGAGSRERPGETAE